MDEELLPSYTSDDYGISCAFYLLGIMLFVFMCDVCNDESGNVVLQTQCAKCFIMIMHHKSEVN